MGTLRSSPQPGGPAPALQPSLRFHPSCQPPALPLPPTAAVPVDGPGDARAASGRLCGTTAASVGRSGGGWREARRSLVTSLGI